MITIFNPSTLRAGHPSLAVKQIGRQLLHHDWMLKHGLSHSTRVCRCRAKALGGFQEGLQSIAVKGASWDLQQPVSDAAVGIDEHINKLRAQKVTHAAAASSLSALWHCAAACCTIPAAPVSLPNSSLR